MHVVVTGSNGLVGRRLVRDLAAHGHRVTATDRQGDLGPQQANPLVPYRALDLADAPALMKALTELAPEVIVNPAAMTDVDGCERDPDGAFAANVEGVATLCRVTKALGAHLLHVSTDYVFDGDAGPYELDAVPNPRGTYAITKHAGEQAVRALLPPERWAIARTAVVYGWPAAGKDNFGSWLLSSLRQGKPVKLFSDQWVSPTIALNVAAMLAELAERKLTGLWHTSGAEVVDRVAFGHRLCAKFGFDPALIQPSRMADVKLASPRPARSGLVVTKTAATLANKPWGLDESLERFLSEYRENPP